MANLRDGSTLLLAFVVASALAPAAFAHDGGGGHKHKGRDHGSQAADSSGGDQGKNGQDSGQEQDAKDSQKGKDAQDAHRHLNDSGSFRFRGDGSGGATGTSSAFMRRR